MSCSVVVATFLGSSFAYSDEAKPTEVVVQAAPRKREPGRSLVGADQARIVAGTRDDALRIVENLPGVARNAFFGTGGIVLWGAAPGDSRILVDGVEVPALYHQGGLRGILPSGLVQTIEVVPGAYGVENGRAVGGLVRVTTRAFPREGIHASLGADFLDASAIVSAAVGDRVRMGGAARVSYLDRLAGAVLAPDVLDTVPIPRYHDMQLKSTVQLRENEEVSAVILGAGDSFVRKRVSSDPAQVQQQSIRNSFYRYYVSYVLTHDDGTRVQVTPFWGHDEAHRESAFGGTPQVLDNNTFRYGLRASYQVPISSKWTTTLGVDAQATRSTLFRQGSLTLPPREGDLYVFGQPPGNEVNADTWTSQTVDVAPFLAAEWRMGKFLVTGGVRGDVYLLETSRQTPRVGQTPAIGRSALLPAVDPRVSVHGLMTKQLTLSLSGGIYHQPPAPEETSAVFGTPNLGLSRAMQASAGGVLRLPLGIDVETAAFYVVQDKLVVRSRLPAPKLALALTQDGEGRNKGLQVHVRRQLKNGWYGSVAYTVSRSERRYVGDSSYRAFDQDQTHVFNATGGYEWHGWGFGFRFRYATGSSRTPVDGSYFNVAEGQFAPIFGAQNSIRLPSFLALDLRVQKKIAIGRTWLVMYLDGTNVTNHDNAEEVVYNFDFSKRSYLWGLPALIMMGARIEL